MPTTLIVVLVLVALPVAFLLYTSALGGRIMGATSTSQTNSKSGFSIEVSSKSDSWDLVEYLCKTLDECLNSTDSGTRWGFISGDSSVVHEIVVESSPEWVDYEFMKIYVVSSNPASRGSFPVTSVGNVPGSKVYEITDVDGVFHALILPVAQLRSAFYKSATFSETRAVR